MSDPQCTFHTDHPDTAGLLRCTADAGHGPKHYFADERGEIQWSWTGSGPARLEARR